MVALPINRLVKAREMLWQGLADIYQLTPQTDQATGLTDGSAWTLLHGAVPCRVSFKQTRTTKEGDLSKPVLLTSLHMRPDLLVPAGCRVTVVQSGRSYRFHRSGVPAVYTTHQEIPLEIEDSHA